MPFRFLPVPVTLPLSDVVERLDQLGAPALYGYASILGRLAAEQRAGRLDLRPAVVTATSETLFPETASTATSGQPCRAERTTSSTTRTGTSTLSSSGPSW